MNYQTMRPAVHPVLFDRKRDHGSPLPELTEQLQAHFQASLSIMQVTLAYCNGTTCVSTYPNY